mmetsp:Transcript_22442/g.32904  ORF Transcript_22442/g.32904 Transcript_22442/m.32904 type:complete len:838 (-) Transcript_22442:500-3013(-)
MSAGATDLRERDAFFGASSSLGSSAMMGATDLRERDTFLGASASASTSCSSAATTTGAIDLRERDAFLGASASGSGTGSSATRTGATDLRERDTFAGTSCSGSTTASTLGADALLRDAFGATLAGSSTTSSSSASSTTSLAEAFPLPLGAALGLLLGAASTGSSNMDSSATEAISWISWRLLMRSTVLPFALIPASLASTISSARVMASKLTPLASSLASSTSSTSLAAILDLEAVAFFDTLPFLGASSISSISSSVSHPVRQSFFWRGVMKCIEATPMVTCGDLGAAMPGATLFLPLLGLGASSSCSSSSTTATGITDLRLLPAFLTCSSTAPGAIDLRPRRGGGAATSATSSSSAAWDSSSCGLGISGITDLRPRRAGFLTSFSSVSITISSTGAAGAMERREPRPLPLTSCSTGAASNSSTCAGDLPLGDKGVGDGDLTEIALGVSTFGESGLGESTLGVSALGESTKGTCSGEGGLGSGAATPEMRRTDETTADATFDTMPLRLQRARLGVLGATSAYASLASKSLSCAGSLPFGDCCLGERDLPLTFLGDGVLCLAGMGDGVLPLPTAGEGLVGAGESDRLRLPPDVTSSSTASLQGVLGVDAPEPRRAILVEDMGTALPDASVASNSSSDSSTSISASICRTSTPVEERRGALIAGRLAVLGATPANTCSGSNSTRAPLTADRYDIFFCSTTGVFVDSTDTMTGSERLDDFGASSSSISIGAGVLARTEPVDERRLPFFSLVLGATSTNAAEASKSSSSSALSEVWALTEEVDERLDLGASTSTSTLAAADERLLVFFSPVVGADSAKADVESKSCSSMSSSVTAFAGVLD